MEMAWKFQGWPWACEDWIDCPTCGHRIEITDKMTAGELAEKTHAHDETHKEA